MTLPFDSREAAADASEALFARTGMVPSAFGEPRSQGAPPAARNVEIQDRAAFDNSDPGHGEAAIQQQLCDSTPRRIGLFRSVADLRLRQAASGAIGQ